MIACNVLCYAVACCAITTCAQTATKSQLCHALHSKSLLSSQNSQQACHMQTGRSQLRRYKEKKQMVVSEETEADAAKPKSQLLEFWLVREYCEKGTLAVSCAFGGMQRSSACSKCSLALKLMLVLCTRQRSYWLIPTIRSPLLSRLPELPITTTPPDKATYPPRSWERMKSWFLTHSNLIHSTQCDMVIDLHTFRQL